MQKTGRPRNLKSGEKLNLYIESELKKRVSRFAFNKNISISQAFALMAESYMKASK